MRNRLISLIQTAHNRRPRAPLFRLRARHRFRAIPGSAWCCLEKNG